MKPESFEKKLYVVRDAEGLPNKEALRTIREIENELNGYKSFIGLVPEGSTFGGYSVENSDIDVCVLCDMGDNLEYSDEREKIDEIGKKNAKRKSLKNTFIFIRHKSEPFNIRY